MRIFKHGFLLAHTLDDLNQTPPQGYHVTDKDEMLVIPQKVVAMLSTAGYFVMFWEFIQDRDYTHVQSWEACERTLAHFKLPPRYTSYESFKDGKSRNKNKGSSKIQVW